MTVRVRGYVIMPVMVTVRTGPSPSRVTVRLGERRSAAWRAAPLGP
jgi:hypothetical protein